MRYGGIIALYNQYEFCETMSKVMNGFKPKHKNTYVRCSKCGL